MKKNRECYLRWSGIRKILLTMRFLALFLFCTAMHLSAAVHSQHVVFSFNLKNATFEDLMKEIRQHSDYYFIYKDSEVASVNKLNKRFKAVEIDEILRECLKGTGLTYFVEDKLIVIRKTNEVLACDTTDKKNVAQSVKGTVVDETGKPLPGVTVVIRGTTVGVATDIDGGFSIVLPVDTATLVFTFVGMETRYVKIAALKKGETRKALRVAMKEDKIALEDVVVTGYANIRKSSFTGNVTSVDRDQLLKANNQNMISALQNFDPSFRIRPNSLWGSDPNALPEINIRGESSIGMNKSLETEYMKQTQRTNLTDNPNLPVFILDGFEVSVQKIYDMDMNRVENVTILKDAAATAMYGSRAANGVVVVTTIAPKPGEMRISYNFTGGAVLPDLSDYNMCNAVEKLEAERLAGVYTSDNTSTQASLDIDYNTVKNKILRGVDTDWLARPLRNVFNHKHTLYVEGGVESIRYSIDFNYDSNGGAMKGSYRDRMGAGMSLDYRYKKLQIRNYVSYNSTRSEDSPYGLFSTYVNLLPYYEIYDDFGNLLKNFSGFAGAINPLWKVKNLRSYSGRSRYHEFMDNFSINLYILEGLQFKGQFSITKTEQTTESFSDPNDPTYDYYDAQEKGRLTKNLSSGYNWNVNAMFYYNRALGKHFINATLGINAKQDHSESHNMGFRGFQLGNLHSAAFAALQPDKTTVGKTESRLFGFLASVNYSFNDIYLFDGSFRLDGSSQFGSDKRFAPFWSFGAGINVHNYSWLKDNGILSKLRVRASYGSTGKVNFPSYTAVTTYEIDADGWYYTGPAAYLVYLGNPKLKWETTKTLDAGIELGFLNDRITFSANYYNKKTEDLIDQISIRPSSGFSEYRSNSGAVVNKGFELDLMATVYRDKDWVIPLIGNLGANKNEITELGAASEAYNKAIDENYEARYGYSALKATPLRKYYKGASTTAIYAVRSAGIDPANGKEKFIKKGGTSTYTWCADDQVVVGDESPDAQGTFAINVGFKGIYLNAAFRYQWGGQTYNETLLKKVEEVDIKTSNVDKRVLSDRWRKPGDIAPFYDLGQQISTRPTTRFVQDENIVEFASLSVGYDFRREMISKWRLTSLGLRFNANDLCRWSTVKEERGINYPYAKNYSFTLSIGF